MDFFVTQISQMTQIFSSLDFFIHRMTRNLFGDFLLRRLLTDFRGCDLFGRFRYPLRVEYVPQISQIYTDFSCFNFLPFLLFSHFSFACHFSFLICHLSFYRLSHLSFVILSSFSFVICHFSFLTSFSFVISHLSLNKPLPKNREK